MPVQHIVLLKLKAGTTETQIDELYRAIMALDSLSMVRSVSAGENFSKRSQGYNFGFELVLDDLDAYQNHPTHVALRDNIILPLVEEGGVLALDYEFPRSVAVHKIGREVATPDMQRWDSHRSNQDIVIEHNSIRPAHEGTVWRVAVAARPIRTKDYVDFTIELNPKPDHRGIEIGIVTRADFDQLAEPGKNFTNFKTGFAWQCNGEFVSGIQDMKQHTVTAVKWEHDHKIGVFVDVEKNILQFFLDHKKHGPAIHHNFGEEVFFAVAMNTPGAKVVANWTAVCPKVFLG